MLGFGKTIRKRSVSFFPLVLDEPRAVLVWKSSSSCIEGVGRTEAEQIRHPGSVDVRKAKETPRKVRRVVISSKQTPELTIEDVFHFLSV